MWIMTKVGFFSIVEKPGDRESGTLTVRARVRADLESLQKHFLPELGPIQEKTGTDYRYRARAKKADVAAALSALTESIDYENFKNEVAKRQGSARAQAYGKVWDILNHLKDTHQSPSSKSTTSAPAPIKSANGKQMAYGGVLVDERSRVLLRRPKGNYGGYVWTFPKGRPDKGETREQAARREVREETGYSAEIIGEAIGCFAGSETVTEYFLMRPVGSPGSFNPDETSETQWATPEQARALIAMTTHQTGRKRDVAVLEAALKALGL